MQDTLAPGEELNQSLLDLHQLATDSSDTNLYQFLGPLPEKQVKFIKELGDHVSNLEVTRRCPGRVLLTSSPLGDDNKKD